MLQLGFMTSCFIAFLQFGNVSWAEEKLASARLVSMGSQEIQGKVFLNLSLDIQNLSSEILAYKYVSGKIVCATDLDHIESKGIVRPGWSWQASSGVLLPFKGKSSTMDSVGAIKRDRLGLIGPLDDIRNCHYQMVIRVIPLDAETYIPRMSEMTEIHISLRVPDA